MVGGREIAAAHYAVSKALTKGHLVKQPCSVCYSTDKIEAHHKDYTKPLEVVWYCRKHHKEEHTRIGKVQHRDVSLNIRNFPDDLLRQLKAKAALDGKLLRDLVIELIEKRLSAVGD